MPEFVKIEGLDGLLDAMKKMPPELISKKGGPCKLAMAAGARVIRDEARRRVSVDSGALRNNIIVRRAKNPARAGATEQFLVGIRGGTRTLVNNKANRREGKVGKKVSTEGTTFYGRFLEFGTQKMAARPFLRPAFEAKKEQALAVIVQKLRDGVAKIQAKLGK